MTTDDIAPAEAADTDIAIVGMAGRFPGAPDVDDAVAARRRRRGLPRRPRRGDAARRRRARRRCSATRTTCGATACSTTSRCSTPAFFGIGPRDAAIMDPQHRHFIECAWEALETSGHVPERFAGVDRRVRRLRHEHLHAQQPADEPEAGRAGRHVPAAPHGQRQGLPHHDGVVQARPARPVGQRADGLLDVAGRRPPRRAEPAGVRVRPGARRRRRRSRCPHRRRLPVPRGRDPRRPTGSAAPSTSARPAPCSTSGAGVVALRRLADALDDGDPILAVIKGTAINNDGQRKVGYLAPSVDGHADVVKEALAVAGLSARDIQLLEAHGTGTAVGDPIEVAALTEAFRASTADVGFCRLVSTKPNIGHLDTAAGVASLIKVVQALRHRTLPPLANHTAPSPLLDLERTPFVIADRRRAVAGRPAAPCRRQLARRRRHQRPRHRRGAAGACRRRRRPRPSSSSPCPAVTTSAVAAGADRLADFLEAHPDTNLADVAHTLATGRRAMPHRRVVAATDTASAIAVLRSNDRNRVGTSTRRRRRRRGWCSCSPAVALSTTAWRPGSTTASTVFHEVMARGHRARRDGLGRRPRPAAAPDAAETPYATRRPRSRRCSSRRSPSPASGWRGASPRMPSSVTASVSTSPPTSPAC